MSSLITRLLNDPSMTLSVFFIVLSVTWFWIGYHNVDLAFNMDRNAIDQAIDGTPRTTRELYQDGCSQLVCSFSSSLLSFFLLYARVKIKTPESK